MAASIRLRLTFWYVGVLAIAAVLLAAGGSWMVNRSVRNAADAALDARVAGVARFIDAMQRSAGPDEMRDEIREYAELTFGDARLEVTDETGTAVFRPSIPGWSTLALRAPSADPAPLLVADRTLAGAIVRVGDASVVTGDHTYHIVAALPMASAYDTLRRFRWLLAACVPVLLLAAAVGGYLISRRALAPVDVMTRAAQTITASHLDRRLDVPAADDELRRLAVTFNDMLSRVQAGVAEMSRLTAEASHELRTPVTLIRTTAELAVSRDRPAEEYRQALTEVLDHAERMTALVGDLLMLARSDAGVEPRETTAVDIARLARSAADDVRPALARTGVTLAVHAPDAPVDARGSEESLKRLILILLDNAIKYSSAGGQVRLVVTSDAGAAASAVAPTARLDVVDTGIGVEAADLPHVFDRFYRSASARQHASDGSGLGLSIAQAIVARSGGSITLGPGDEERGCRAVVVLPMAEAGEKGKGQRKAEG